MKKIFSLLIFLMPLALLAQSVGQLRYDTVKVYKQGGQSVLKVEGAMQASVQGGANTSSFSAVSIGRSFTLGTISSDQTVTFPTLESGRSGTFMLVENVNGSAFIWNVAGPVIEAGTGTAITTIPIGLHFFWWNGSAWARLSTGSGSSPITDTLTFTSPLVQIGKNVSIDFNAFPYDTTGVVIHNDSLFNILYPWDNSGRDSSFIVKLNTGGGTVYATDGVRMDGDTVKLENSFTPRIQDNVVLRVAPTKAIYLYNDAGDVLMNVDDSQAALGNGGGNNIAVYGGVTPYAQIAGRTIWKNAPITTTTDVDLTIAGNAQYFPFIKLTGTLAANRNLTLPSGVQENEFLTVLSTNGNAFKWQVAGASVYELDGTAITEFDNNKTYDLIWNASASRWQRKTGGDGGYLAFDSVGTGEASLISENNVLRTRLFKDTYGTYWDTAIDRSITGTIDTNLITSKPSRQKLADSLGALIGSGKWALIGNSISAADSIFGTTSNHGVKIITNNTEMAVFRRDGRIGRTDKSGTNVVGDHLNFMGGIGTGNAAAGGIRFWTGFVQASGTGLHVPTERGGLAGTGQWVFGGAISTASGSEAVNATTLKVTSAVTFPFPIATGTNSGRMPGIQLKNSSGAFLSANNTALSIEYVNRDVGGVWTSAYYDHKVYDNTVGGILTGFEWYTHNRQTSATATVLAMQIKGLTTTVKAFATAITSKSTTYAATISDYTIKADATSAGFTITLPTAVGADGQIYVVKKIDATANVVTIATTSSQTIDGATTYTGLSAQWKYAQFQSDGANWIVIGNN